MSWSFSPVHEVEMERRNWVLGLAYESLASTTAMPIIFATVMRYWPPQAH
jgi:hypothetical protein